MRKKSTGRARQGQQETFARQYVILNFNGQAAAIAAGYAPKSAHVAAARLLSKDKVKALVAKYAAPTIKKEQVTVERTLIELARCAFLDPRVLFRADGSLKKVTELDADTAACIAAVETGGRGAKRLVRVKMTDKLRALDMLARYLKMFAEDRNPQDLSIKYVVLDMPRPLRQGNQAQLPPANGNGHNGNGAGGHD